MCLCFLKLACGSWSGCGLNANTKLVKGESSSLCLVISGPDSWESTTSQKYARFMYEVSVDDFAKLSIANSFAGLRGGDNDLLLANYTNPSIHVESGIAISYIKRYRGLLDDTTNTAVTWPYMTAIINVDMGEITGITWDDGCHFCEETSCADNTYDFRSNKIMDDNLADSNCYVLDDECASADGKFADNCQVTVYAVWTGTDAQGKLLTSAEKRFSQYKRYSVMDFVKDTKSKYSEVKDLMR